MKLKQQIKAKPALNKVQKGKPLKKQQENNLTAVQKIQKGTKGPVAPNKKHAAPSKVLPKKKVLEEEEDDDSEDDEVDDLAGLLDLEAESGEEDDADLSGEEEGEEEGEDSDDEDEEEEEEDDDEDISKLQIDEGSDAGGSADEDDNDEPIEAPIVKIEKKAKPEKAAKPVAAVSVQPDDNIKIGLMPKNIAFDRIVVVKNIPKASKQKDLVAIFGKYGTIVHIQTNHDDGHKVCLVAYEDSTAARNALGENKKATIKDTKLHVTAQLKDAQTKPAKEKATPKSKEEHQREIAANKDRTISVGHLAKGTNEDDIRKHFGGCGAIASINVIAHKKLAFVVFGNTKDVAKAKKLHQSILKGATVTVRGGNDGGPTDSHDTNLTIVLKNPEHLKSIQVDKLRNIFSKCGEVGNINVICGRDVLAFITFKQDKSVKKALKLNGTSSDGLKIEVEQCKAPEKNTSIIIHNLKPSATETDVRQHFAEAGEIVRVTVKPGFASVQFKDADAFCKSFLLNESSLLGQLIFLEPFSAKKQQILKKPKSKPFFGKRPHAPPKPQQGGPAKKFKADKNKRQNGV